MALLAVKHLDPVVGVDVHSVLVTPGTPPVFLPHPHVGFMLDKREYIQAAKAVVGCIATMIAQEKLTEYIEHHPEDVTKLEHLADEANQQVNELMGGGKLPDFKDNPTVAEGVKLAKGANRLKNRISDDLGSNVGAGGGSGRPIFVNGMMRATAGTHAYHVPGLHFPLGESFAPPPEEVEPSNDGESFMGSKTVLANNDPMSYMALEALSCWSIGMEPPPHNSAHTDRTYPSMPSAVMLPIPAGRPVLVGGPPIMNMAAAAKGLFKAFRGSKWAKALADKLHLKSGFLRCTVLHAEPVDALTGEVVVQQNDFTVAGRLPLVWNRYYASRDTTCRAIGVGWQTLADIRLELTLNEGGIGAAAFFPDHSTAFDAIPNADGWAARVYDWQNGYALFRRDEQLVLRTRAGLEYEFVLPAREMRLSARLAEKAAVTLLVARMADLNSNAWIFERGSNHSLVRLIEWKDDGATGRMIQCEAATISHAAGHSSLLTALRLIDSECRAHSLVGYEHDRNGDLVTVFDAMGQPHRYVYADGHLMIRHTDARGVSFHYNHQRHGDGEWRVDHAWSEGRLFDYHFVYDLAHRETRIIDSLAHTTILQANERGMPVARIDPLGGITTYRYDTDGRASAATDPASRTTAWTYDAYGDLVAQMLPDGSVVHAEYTEHHKPMRVTAPDDRQWCYVWDERCNLLEQTTPAQATLRYEYDRSGQPVALQGPRGAVTRLDYDRDGNLAEVIDALGHRTRYMHDARGNVVQIVNALGQSSRYEYDCNDNLTRAFEPGEREICCSYDANGNLVRYRDPDGLVTQLEYSALGQVTKRVMPDGSSIEYEYDTEEQLIAVVNERGERYRLKRDALGRIVEEIDYWGQSRRYEYGSAGELQRIIDPLGLAIEYETDRRGRIVLKRVRDPRQPEGFRTETFKYDRRGNLVMAENPDSRVALTYDSASRVVAEKQGADFMIAHTYDMTGNRIERRTRLQAGDQTTAHAVRFDYDALDAVSLIQIDGDVPITFERDTLGQLRVEHLGTELRRESSYTSEGLLANQVLFSGSGPLFANEYAYDVNGELRERRDSRLGIERFEYDSTGKLTGHLDPTGKLHRFLYDPAGNLLETRVREHGSAGAADGPEADTWVRDGEHGGYYYAFDRIGNLVRKRNALQDLRLRWDGDGLLIETVMERRASAEVGGASGTLCIHTRYAYDVFHRRTRKDTRIECGVDTWAIGSSDSTVLSRNSSFFWDGDALIGEALSSDRQANRLLSDLAGAANTTRPHSSGRHATAPVHAATVSMDSYGEAREWVYYPGTFRPLAGMRCAYAMDTTAPQFVVCHGQATRLPVSRSEPAEPYFFHNDPNGAPTTIIGARGSIVWEGSYSAWGWVSLHGDRDEFEQPLRFQGQQHDDETGLHYNRNRYYDCDAGRFISLDPIGVRAGNIETYAPNAITWIDPLGLARQQLTKDDAVLRLYAERDQMERNQIFKGKQGGTVIAGVINRETEEMEFGERGWTGMPHFLQTYRMQDLTRFPNGSRVAGTNILGCAESPAFAVLLATDANILPGYEPLADLGHYTSFAWTRTGNGTWVPKRACLNCVGLYGDAHLASGIDG